MKEKTKIECEVLEILKDEPYSGGNSGVQIRLVQWIVDGKKFDPTLEKRVYSITKDGTKIFRKAKGFSLPELDLICKKNSEMKK